MIPLLHDFEGETVLVVGGGPVGARKARRFAREADVVVVSPAFADRDFGDAQLVREAPDPDAVRAYVDRLEPALVVAATDDDAVNEAASSAARDAGALVNRTDDHGDQAVGEVSVPATVRDDPVTVAVATGGTAPALSKYVRQRFEEDFAGIGEMATLVGTVREDLQDRGVPPAARRDAVRAVVRDARVWKALDRGRSNALQVAAEVVDERLGDSS